MDGAWWRVEGENPPPATRHPTPPPVLDARIVPSVPARCQQIVGAQGVRQDDRVGRNQVAREDRIFTALIIDPQRNLLSRELRSRI